MEGNGGRGDPSACPSLSLRELVWFEGGHSPLQTHIATNGWLECRCEGHFMRRTLVLHTWWTPKVCRGWATILCMRQLAMCMELQTKKPFQSAHLETLWLPMDDKDGRRGQARKEAPAPSKQSSAWWQPVARPNKAKLGFSVRTDWILPWTFYGF